jgi:hypothetical protein
MSFAGRSSCMKGVVVAKNYLESLKVLENKTRREK